MQKKILQPSASFSKPRIILYIFLILVLIFGVIFLIVKKDIFQNLKKEKPLTPEEIEEMFQQMQEYQNQLQPEITITEEERTEVFNQMQEFQNQQTQTTMTQEERDKAFEQMQSFSAQ